MSQKKLYRCSLILTLSVFVVGESANVYYRYRMSRCIFGSSKLSGVVYFDNYYFNKYLFIQFDSTLGKFVGFNDYGIKLAEFWNNGTFVQFERDMVEVFCRQNSQFYEHSICDKAVKPKVKLSSVTRADGRKSAVLMCSAYEFYPPHIKVYWLRNGEVITSEVTSTMEMADGDWYYQIHSELEYSPKSGERISCVIEHASSNKPMIYDWDPSIPVFEGNKISIGVSALVLGIITAAAGIIYYKKKTPGGIPVLPSHPTTLPLMFGS